MPSPFPGMNPYLEEPDIWGDFHLRFLVYIAGALEALVGPKYLVKIDNRRSVNAQREAFIEIRDRRDRRVVTVIELLSPTNKTKGPDRDQYLNKRGHILASPTHLVEIDLLRGGERPSLPEPPQSPYYALVSRSQDRPEFGFWPIGMREPLPPLPIPLSPPDPEVSLDIQAVLHRVYDEANYGKYIYEDEPQPRLSADDATWARTVLK